MVHFYGDNTVIIRPVMTNPVFEAVRKQEESKVVPPPPPPPKGWEGVASPNPLYMDSLAMLSNMKPLKPRLTSYKRSAPSKRWADIMDEEDGLDYN